GQRADRQCPQPADRRAPGGQDPGAVGRREPAGGAAAGRSAARQRHPQGTGRVRRVSLAVAGAHRGDLRAGPAAGGCPGEPPGRAPGAGPGAADPERFPGGVAMKVARGFTLLELLIAIALFALLGTGTYRLLDTVLRADAG